LTDAVVINADGSKTETISDFKAGGVLRDKTVVTTTADGLSETDQWDGAGAGSLTRSATDVTVINANGSTTETLSNLNANSSLHDKIYTATTKDKAVVDTSADGLSTSTKWDLTGIRRPRSRGAQLLRHATKHFDCHTDGRPGQCCKDKDRSHHRQ